MKPNRMSKNLSERWQDEVKGKKKDSVVIEEDLDGVNLKAELGPYINGRQVFYRCVKEPREKTE